MKLKITQYIMEKKKVEFATDLYKLCYQKHSPVLVS